MESLTFFLNTFAVLSNPQSPIFFLITSTAPWLLSTNTQSEAPLLNASMPMAPVPAKRSRTFFSERSCTSTLNMASLTLSFVGFIEGYLKDASVFPFLIPPTTLIAMPLFLSPSRYLDRYEPAPWPVEFRKVYRLPLPEPQPSPCYGDGDGVAHEKGFEVRIGVFSVFTLVISLGLLILDLFFH